MAIQKYHGGINEFRKKLGEEILKYKNGTMKNWETFKPLLKELIDAIGHFPSTKDFDNLQKSSIMAAIYKHHGGVNKVKERLTTRR